MIWSWQSQGNLRKQSNLSHTQSHVHLLGIRLGSAKSLLNLWVYQINLFSQISKISSILSQFNQISIVSIYLLVKPNSFLTNLEEKTTYSDKQEEDGIVEEAGALRGRQKNMHIVMTCWREKTGLSSLCEGWGEIIRFEGRKNVWIRYWFWYPVKFVKILTYI